MLFDLAGRLGEVEAAHVLVIAQQAGQHATHLTHLKNTKLYTWRNYSRNTKPIIFARKSARHALAGRITKLVSASQEVCHETELFVTKLNGLSPNSQLYTRLANLIMYKY